MNVTYNRSLLEVVLHLVKALAVNSVCGVYQHYQRRQWLGMRQKTRLQLRHLTAEQLDDVGITRDQADDEMKKTYR
jgi:uncharacterized protein YjiS (DUF1127 family)